MNSSLSNDLTRGQKLIIKYLQDLGEFSKPQKVIANAIGYTREGVNRNIKKLEKLGIVKVEHRIGVDPHLVVISLVKDING